MNECVPVKLLRLLTGHSFTTARQKGWGGFKNGQLLALVERELGLFLSFDRNVEYQQNLESRQIAILLLSTNHWPTLKQDVRLVQAQLDQIQPRELRRVEPAAKGLFKNYFAFLSRRLFAPTVTWIGHTRREASCKSEAIFVC